MNQPDILSVLLDTASFSIKALVVFITVVATWIIILLLSRKGRQSGGRVEVKPLNERVEALADELRQTVLDPKEYKKQRKARAKADKAKEKPTRNAYIIDFKGDIMASAVEALRAEITAILLVARPEDEIVLRLESPGGVVHGYGLAASQLARARAKNIRLVISVDKVAASGGYMMACVGNEIIAAPFAVLGSIGVAAPVPNAHKLLNRFGIDYDEMTAGEYKRTVSTFGQITDKGRAKFQEQLDDTHALFKEFVSEYRPSLDMQKIATGEHWYGPRALNLGLADRLQTSDDYLLSLLDSANLFEVTFHKPKSLKQKLTGAAEDVTERLALRLWSLFNRPLA
jgi:serine protease SohB